LVYWNEDSSRNTNVSFSKLHSNILDVPSYYLDSYVHYFN
jgi:hypothetical protein